MCLPQESIHEGDEVAHALASGCLEWPTDITVDNLQALLGLRDGSLMCDRALLLLLDTHSTLGESLALHVDAEFMCDDMKALFACMTKMLV